MFEVPMIVLEYIKHNFRSNHVHVKKCAQHVDTSQLKIIYDNGYLKVYAGNDKIIYRRKDMPDYILSFVGSTGLQTILKIATPSTINPSLVKPRKGYATLFVGVDSSYNNQYWRENFGFNTSGWTKGMLKNIYDDGYFSVHNGFIYYTFQHMDTKFKHPNLGLEYVFRNNTLYYKAINSITEHKFPHQQCIWSDYATQ